MVADMPKADEERLSSQEIEEHLEHLAGLADAGAIAEDCAEIRALRELKAARAQIKEMEPYVILHKIRSGDSEP